MQEIVGQIFGIVAFIIAFFAYQMSTSKKVLMVQTVAIVSFCIHYLLIGAIPGFALNLLGVARNLIYYNNDKKFFRSKAWPIVLSVLMVIVGCFTGKGWHAVLLIVGLAVNTYCMSLSTSQAIRISLLFTCPPVLVYNIFELSIGGMVNEALSIVSATVGIIRERAKKGEENIAEEENK